MLEPTSGKRLIARSFVRLIDNCRSLDQLKQIHAHLITCLHRFPFQPNRSSALAVTSIAIPPATFLLNRLLIFAATSDNGFLPYAIHLFQSTPNPTIPMYNAMIRAHARITGDAASSTYSPLSLYKLMFSNGVRPDHLTFTFVFKHCGEQHRRDSSVGRSVHCHVFKLGFVSDLFVQNAAITMYAHFGMVCAAIGVFNEMTKKDVVSWNSMLMGCLRCGEFDMAVKLFAEMPERNVMTWNSVITGLAQGGRSREALTFFQEMLVLPKKNCIKPDKITLASLISACASLGALDQGVWAHRYLTKRGLEMDAAIGTALVDMYGKCGCIEKAIEVFDDMPEKDVFAWTAIISAFSTNGQAEEAFRLLGRMQELGKKPNQVTFCALLSGCVHSGLLEKGRWCFHLMKHAYHIEPNTQHLACMVDLLSRQGLFDEALDLIKSMSMEPDTYVWGALLGGCRIHGNVELGERLFELLLSMDPQNPAFYIALSDIYAKAGRFDGVKNMRLLMNKLEIRKVFPGCSMIEVDGKVYEFSVAGTSDVSLEEIKEVLEWATQDMKSI